MESVSAVQTVKLNNEALQMELPALPLRHRIRRRDESAAIKSTKTYRRWLSSAVESNSSLGFLPESFGEEASITTSHPSNSVSVDHSVQSLLRLKDVIREDGRPSTGVIYDDEEFLNEIFTSYFLSFFILLSECIIQRKVTQQ